MDEDLHVDLLPTLKKLQSSRNAKMSKQCRYHCNFGHTTEVYQTPKNKIEELIQADHLRKFFQTNKSLYESLQRERYPCREQKE